MSEDKKKAREEFWLNRLQATTDLKFEIDDQRELRERPDFLIRHQGRIVGVEIAELQLDRDRGPSKGSALQKEFSLQRKVVSRAQELYYAIKNRPINAQVYFQSGPGQSLQSVNHRDLAQAIVESLHQVTLDPFEQCRLDPYSAPPVPSPVGFVYARGLPSQITPRWQVVAPGWSKEFQSSDVESLLAEKNALTQPTRAIPMKLAIPLFQAASLEDDDYLQDLWASLLVNAANAASGVDLKRAYIEILEQMTPTEVKILEVIYSLPFDETLHHGVTTADLPDAASVAGDTEKIEQPSGPSDEVKLALANLDRLGCVTFLKSWGGGELYATVNPNFLGKSFVNACTLKNRI